MFGLAERKSDFPAHRIINVLVVGDYLQSISVLVRMDDQAGENSIVTKDNDDTTQYCEAIQHIEMGIYNPVKDSNSDLWLPAPKLEQKFNAGMVGKSLAELPIRTRSKAVH